jgi:hypothetical protein
VQRYSWDTAAAKYVQIYAQVVATPARQPGLVFRQ